MALPAADEAALAAPAPTQRFKAKGEAILAAAALLFNECGVKGATLGDIAASVGLATNSVTYYYRKKEALATACFLRAIEVFDGLVQEASGAPLVAQRLSRFFELHAQLLMAVEAGTQPPLILFNDIRALPDPHADVVFAAYTNLFRRMRGLLQGPETAGLTRAELNARAHLVISVAHWARGWVVRGEAADFPRVARRVVDFLLHGLQGAGRTATWPVDPRAKGNVSIDLSAGLGDDSGSTEPFLRAATVLVNEQGYRGASVDRISARLHVTKGSFYHHHDNKHDLISACFERSFNLHRCALAAVESSPAPGWQRVRAVAVSLVQFQLSVQGPLLRSTATSALPDAGDRARVRRTMQSLTDRLGSIIVDGMVDGSIRPLDPAIAALTINAMINAAAELRRWMPGASEANVADAYVRPAFQGVLCAPLAITPHSDP